ncbi:hypothetical protein PHYBLDRAFT_147766 [Phycomyces blakesleeanus NRRL 1555(-)]|uniref:Uncharacterized protein n=1 Tax=Phycomyces blakesleeanus (strain ATCC 8743b / DSM 1359 / FGSC 10004 / NBRC 33097 / NRRL 1555) TaxID=763407 RepID=A0A162WWI3_PHYB8|nr:hypothetical protein PHYBLDRAFT_147751 [Phycomyces blakesleeanus NRRL 1555(-)]XP_018289305.1 hypothetical protein PHYBLDRAFT_147766 [Phycomyces blakesleeanus NRRL 1555(-)]OAD71247.1 hypothetical protein PHYBLDRAFT_147751 [Phycomyces blakesleeanus NRRL 1555(-)]OAD71265.1 hypothetical protein PHYBLDRAFT_147766 [Phycomyces blakesleeanus NRRL 1555(-)]|eukprot:XP_018289287.1 hypothetical protein PHYBLDRAFT_147751 [Phycomyces blakesleeanus NRRL 1555(-)]
MVVEHMRAKIRNAEKNQVSQQSKACKQHQRRMQTPTNSNQKQRETKPRYTQQSNAFQLRNNRMLANNNSEKQAKKASLTAAKDLQAAPEIHANKVQIRGSQMLEINNQKHRRPKSRYMDDDCLKITSRNTDSQSLDNETKGTKNTTPRLPSLYYPKTLDSEPNKQADHGVKLEKE